MRQRRALLGLLTAAIVIPLTGIAAIAAQADTTRLISEGRPSTSSTTEGPGFEASHAFDGDAATRWASAEGVDDQWVQVDLGAGSRVERVVLNWEAAHASEYDLRISADGVNWTTLAHEAAGDGGIDEHAGLNAAGRYLRVHGTARAAAYGYSLFEVQVYGTPGTTTPTPTPTPNPTDALISTGKPVVASSVESPGHEAGKAVDADASTRWASAEGAGTQWIRVDLGTGAKVSKVVVTWEAAYAKRYTVDMSNDGTTWTPLTSETAGDGATDEHTGLNGTGRYLRINATERGTAYGYSLFELEAYGVAGTPGGGNPTEPTEGAWPGSSLVSTADSSGAFGADMSGLAFSADGSALWAVSNGNGTLHRLTQQGSNWAPSSGWSGGRTLRYPNGSGTVDAEGVAVVGADIFVASERNASSKSTSRPSILKYATSGSGAITATREWNLTSDLPSVDANEGLESIAWIPDADLVAAGFVDQRTGAAYDPASYANHGTGLFFVGLEASGDVYAYALNQGGSSYTRLAVFGSGFDTVMELEYQSSTKTLWALCDDTCDGEATALKVASGAFAVTARHDRPIGMPNLNNEGFALAPQCIAGSRSAVWADDGETDGHALRTGSMSCS
ncbi:discoidin domain-containing protein [Microbacterium aurantiacum]|uniref:discoidin domain-containing protein n=1 Tax=Microbacterium aurantiacum TaxID=162393 RepID=UPI000C80EFE5|nr:discoidin domain-containing protein [Microbacterium aurantiacum]